MMERHKDDGFCLNRVVVFPADANGRWIQRVAALLMVGLLFSGCGGGGGGGGRYLLPIRIPPLLLPV